ncbi:MAG: hypothetical protein ABI425_03590 [Patescibacteria group bacterium]
MPNNNTDPTESQSAEPAREGQDHPTEDLRDRLRDNEGDGDDKKNPLQSNGLPPRDDQAEPEENFEEYHNNQATAEPADKLSEESETH